MALILRMVAGFGTFPDGRLRAGPFDVPGPGRLYQQMDRFGLRPGATGTVGMVSETAEGIMLSATGDGVFGYMLDTEALEASRTDLEEFLVATIRPGRRWSMAGHWCPDPDRMIRSEAIAWHDGVEVFWQESREILHRDGRLETISRSRPSVISSASMIRIA